MRFNLSLKFFLCSPLVILLFVNSFSQSFYSGLLESNIDKSFFKNRRIQNSIGRQPLNLFQINENFQISFERQHLIELMVEEENLNFYCDSCNSISDLRFVTGSRRSNGLKLNHEQKLGGFGSFLLDFSSKSSIGFFQRDKQRDIFFKPVLVFKSVNNKYNFSLAYESYKFLRELYGGLSSDSLFLNSRNLSANLNPINLKSSESVLKSKVVSLRNSYSLFERKLDSMVQPMFKLKKVFAKSELDYSINKYGFYSQDKDFFEDYFLDTVQTKDTLALKSLTHLLGFGVDVGSDSTSLIVMPYFLNGHYEYINLDKKNEYQTYSTGLEVSYSNKRKELYGSLRFQNDYVEEFDKDQKKISGHVAKSLTRKYWICAEANFSQNYSPLLMSKYYSNNFIWNNSFSNENKVVFRAGISNLSKKDVLSLDYTVIKNYIFFNSSAIPEQDNSAFSIMRVHLSREIVVDRFTFIPKVKFTTVNKTEKYHYPEFVFNPEVNYARDLFKEKLNFSTGIRFFYFSAFYADSYMPTTDQYYFQSEIKSGNYPMFDFFIKFKIKRAELFFELNHFNEGLSGKDYFLTPHYPMTGRNLFFGINWKLVN